MRGRILAVSEQVSVAAALKILSEAGGAAAVQPQLSILLPTFEPNGWFRPALESVLRDAPVDAEIGVIDDASVGVDVEKMVAEIAPAGRVAFSRNSRRLGLAGNWNRAVASARGELIHLLHQDDFILPGFYRRMLRAFQQQPEIGMVFCRTRIVDSVDRVTKTTSRVRWFPGIVPNWLATVGQRQRVQTPSAIVARSTYEVVGGYRHDLKAALDWEMWVRIAARFPVWYEPATLAAYRRHDANESSRLSASGEVWPDLARAIAINAESFPPAERLAIVERSVRWYTNSALRTATKRVRRGDYAAASRILEHLPKLLDLLADDQLGSAIQRRAGAIRQQLQFRRAA